PGTCRNTIEPAITRQRGTQGSRFQPKPTMNAPTAGPDGRDHLAKHQALRREVKEHKSCVDEIKPSLVQLVIDDVMKAYLDIRRDVSVHPTRVDICQHNTASATDALAQPDPYRSSTRADFETRPALADADPFEVRDGDRIPARFQARQLAAPSPRQRSHTRTRPPSI